MATDPESYCEQIRVMASYIDELCYLSGDTNNDFRNGRDQRYHISSIGISSLCPMKPVHHFYGVQTANPYTTHINYNLWTIYYEEQTVCQ